MIKRKVSNYNNIGKLTGLIGILLLCPLMVLPFYPEDVRYAYAFLLPGLFSVALGILICIVSEKVGETGKEFSIHRGNLLVLYIWGYSCLIGAVPFVLGDKLTFIQGLFESVSGWTTTGLSVMDVESAPHIFLFYRSFMQFCGGLGFVMIMIAFVQGKLAMNLYQAEGHSDKIMPTLKETVRSICVVYLSCLFIGVIAYRLCGMPVFDGILHTMGALSTGGFSNQADSIGAYHSLSIEGVTIVLMLIGTTNFAVLLLAVHQKWREFICSSELKFLMLLLVIFVPATAFSLMNGLYISLGEGTRQALFNIVSALSTTGYSTMSYGIWPPASIGIMIVMMLIGGGIGSTAGGIKLARVLVMLKSSWYCMRGRVCAEHEVKKPFYYRAQGKTIINSCLIKETSGFITIYLLVFTAGTLLLSAVSGASLTDAMFEFASSLGTVGLSVGITGPLSNGATLLVEIFGMFLGRLEILIVFTGMYSAVYLLGNKWKEKKKKTGIA